VHVRVYAHMYTSVCVCVSLCMRARVLKVHGGSLGRAADARRTCHVAHRCECVHLNIAQVGS
jgi:hypothetical protein